MKRFSLSIECVQIISDYVAELNKFFLPNVRIKKKHERLYFCLILYVLCIFYFSVYDSREIIGGGKLHDEKSNKINRQIKLPLTACFMG